VNKRAPGFCSVCRRRRCGLVVVRQCGGTVAVCRECWPKSEPAILARLKGQGWRPDRVGQILPDVVDRLLLEVAR